MTTTTAAASTAPPPSAVRLGLARAGIELKTFFRQWDAVVFTFALPIVLLVMLGMIFSDIYEGSTVTASQYFVPGMLAAGVASTTFVNLGGSIAADRDDGTLRRLRGAPMPPSAYFIGKVLMAVAVTAVEVVLVLAVGVLLFDLSLPSTPQRWFTAAWVLILGTTACALLGIAASGLARSARTAGAVFNLPYLVLGFCSGVFFTPISALPAPLLQFGALFPLRWMAQGFRSAFLPDTILSQEVVHSWEHAKTALVLVAWIIGGAVLALRVFSWKGRHDG
jgi:ABC-2 type transport system permease protein